MSIALAPIALAAAALGPVVLRGSEQADPRPVVRIDIRGVEVGAPAELELIGWERVKLVLGEETSEAAPFMALADAAWRAETRLVRGDVTLAAPLLEDVFRRMNSARSPTTLLAAAGLAHVRLVQGDYEGALAPMFATLALREAGVTLDTRTARVVGLEGDELLFPGLPPLWKRGSSAATMLRSIDAGAREGFAAQLHTLYLIAATADEGSSVELPDAPSEHIALQFVHQLVAARAGDAHEREAARVGLRAQIPLALGTWREAWIRAALGRSHLREERPVSKDTGLLELLQLPARLGGVVPELAAIALDDATFELESRGLIAPSAALRTERRRIEGRMSLETPADAGDPAIALARFLQNSGLDDLLAFHLERELAGAEGSRRTDVARRLAGVYARLLESPPSEARRLELEKRSLEVLADVPEGDSMELRLTLARSAYTRAEQTAERWRLRLVSRAEADSAARTFGELESSFTEMAIGATRRVEGLERQEESAGTSSDRELLATALTSARRTRSIAHFLAGWSSYYGAELGASTPGGGGASEAATRAERHFGWLLNAKAGSTPVIERVPEQLLSYEHVARSVIGVALAQSLKGGDEIALRWLDLLEQGDSVSPAIKDQLPLRRLIVLARAARWDDVLRMLSGAGTGEGSVRAMPPTTARLAAVLALEAKAAGNPSKALEPLVARSLEALAAQGQLAQVSDLASRYMERLDEFGAGGFMPAYIRGVREYDRARKAHEAGGESDENPTSNAEALRLYEAAAKFFSQAIAAPDSSVYPSALGGVSVLRALATFYSAKDAATLERAAIMFSQASEKFAKGEEEGAANARRLAVRAIDAAIARENTPAFAKRRAELIDDFLAKHPGHESAAEMLYQRATAPGVLVERAVADLLAIPDDSSLAFAARHQAARLLYERYIAAPYEGKQEAAHAFLAVSEPLLQDSRRPGAASDDQTMQRAAVNARRVLDAILSRPGADPHRAQRAMDLLTGLISRGQVSVPAILAEAEYRRAQIALLRDDAAGAEAALAKIAELDPKLARAASRLFYQHSADRWSVLADDDPERASMAHRVVDLGTRAIREAGSDEAALREAPIATLHATVARAAATLWELEQDVASRDLASLLFRGLLRMYPNDSGFLKDAALHAERAGDAPGALEAWRGLVAGLPQGADEWFEAKCRVVELLIKLDPVRAREVLQQHHTLYPDYGPTPWGQRLREMARTLEAKQ